MKRTKSTRVLAFPSNGVVEDARYALDHALVTLSKEYGVVVSVVAALKDDSPVLRDMSRAMIAIFHARVHVQKSRDSLQEDFPKPVAPAPRRKVTRKVAEHE